MNMLLLAPSRILLALVLCPASAVYAQAPTADTVSVPLSQGDSATVTGTLAVRRRGSRQFLVIESPTPYRLVHDQQSGAAAGKVIRDIPIHLPGQDAQLTGFSGRTITATGHLHFEPAATSWNGALLESSIVILPGGKELKARKH